MENETIPEYGPPAYRTRRSRKLDRLVGGRWFRTCRTCSVEYPYDLSNFHLARGRKTLDRQCKRCKSDYQREYLRKKKYDVGPEEFAAVFHGQGGMCAICGVESANALGYALHVDHDHRTGQVRGLLCQNCNVALGHFKDDPNILIAAIKYLESA